MSGTPCPQHIIVPFGAEAPLGHVAPGLSNPTSFLRPALPMAPTTDNNARDERSVLRPNLATFLRDFTLYMTKNYAILRKRVSKLYYMFNPFVPTALHKGTLKQCFSTGVSRHTSVSRLDRQCVAKNWCVAGVSRKMVCRDELLDNMQYS